MGVQLYPFGTMLSHTDQAIRHRQQTSRVSTHPTLLHRTMNYNAFPSQRPNEDALATTIAAALEQIYKTQRTTTGMVEVCRSSPDGISTDVVCRLPRPYAPPILQLLFRRYALSLVLHYAEELDIEPYIHWLALAQNLLYLTSQGTQNYPTI
jgi:hypothetical protein